MERNTDKVDSRFDPFGFNCSCIITQSFETRAPKMGFLVSRLFI